MKKDCDRRTDTQPSDPIEFRFSWMFGTLKLVNGDWERNKRCEDNVGSNRRIVNSFMETAKTGYSQKAHRITSID